LAAALASWLMDATIGRTAIPGLDWVVSFPAGAVAVTMFVVAGVANAFNIVDGFNGLSTMCVNIVLAAVAVVAWRVGDGLITTWALVGIGATLGFFVWNFPAGRIFLGDGGAYFLGFYVAELAILLMHRNAAVSPMFALLVCIYPVFETVFSIYRKKVLRSMSPGLPDGVHLHMLVYKRLVRRVGLVDDAVRVRRNSMTSPYLWLLCLVSVLPAMVFWDNTAVLATCIVLFGFLYVALYWRIVRFRTPRALVRRSAPAQPVSLRLDGANGSEQDCAVPVGVAASKAPGDVIG
jgi:UDP-N-acetylmuramyl pentapeptide phosphotransferase/UDP-N-acetylglucosamine-1-phosphate transferase